MFKPFPFPVAAWGHNPICDLGWDMLLAPVQGCPPNPGHAGSGQGLTPIQPSHNGLKLHNCKRSWIMLSFVWGYCQSNHEPVIVGEASVWSAFHSAATSLPWRHLIVLFPTHLDCLPFHHAPAHNLLKLGIVLFQVLFKQFYLLGPYKQRSSFVWEVPLNKARCPILLGLRKPCIEHREGFFHSPVGYGREEGSPWLRV